MIEEPGERNGISKGNSAGSLNGRDLKMDGNMDEMTAMNTTRLMIPPRHEPPLRRRLGTDGTDSTTNGSPGLELVCGWLTMTGPVPEEAGLEE
jgi:hypothetical protein